MRKTSKLTRPSSCCPPVSWPVPDMVIVADTRHLTGLRAWWGTLYNQGHLQFALLTVLMIPVAGIILGGAGRFRHAADWNRPEVPTLREN